MSRLFLMAFALLLLTSCYSARMVAPQGREIKTLAEDDTAQFKKEVKLWYALWGLVPITQNNSARIIAEYNLESVRVTTKFKFSDILIGIFTGVASIYPHTMIIEGNRSTAAAVRDRAAAQFEPAKELPHPKRE